MILPGDLVSPDGFGSSTYGAPVWDKICANARNRAELVPVDSEVIDRVNNAEVLLVIAVVSFSISNDHDPINNQLTYLYVLTQRNKLGYVGDVYINKPSLRSAAPRVVGCIDGTLSVLRAVATSDDIVLCDAPVFRLPTSNTSS